MIFIYMLIFLSLSLCVNVIMPENFKTEYYVKLNFCDFVAATTITV